MLFCQQQLEESISNNPVKRIATVYHIFCHAGFVAYGWSQWSVRLRSLFNGFDYQLGHTKYLLLILLYNAQHCRVVPWITTVKINLLGPASLYASFIAVIKCHKTTYYL